MPVNYNEDYITTEINVFFESVLQTQIIFTDEMMATINYLKLQGLQPEAIVEVIKASFFGDNAKVNGIFNKIGVDLWDMAKTISQLSVFKGLGEDMYRWEYNPGANHCPGCIERNGKEKKLSEWVALGLPGTGSTECHSNCMCDLVEVKQ